MKTLTLTAGQDESFTATFKNGDGTPMDLVGYTVALNNRRGTIPANVTVGTGGAVAVSMTAAQTSKMRSSPRVFFLLSNGSGVSLLGPFKIEVV
jgi:hypothetical protein